MGDTGRPEYARALRRCYYSLLLKPDTLPNHEDSQHKEMVELLKRTNTNVMVFGAAGVPLLYFFYTKVLKPRFPVQTGIRALSLVGALTLYIVGFRLMSNSNAIKSILTDLTRKYEKELILQCPELKEFTKVPDPISVQKTVVEKPNS
jgi:hypothetical protein